MEGSDHASSRQHRPFRGKAKVQNHQLTHLQQSPHQPWSLTFWLDDEVIKAWYESATPSSRGRPQRYSDLAITTVLVLKRVFRLTLRAAQGFIDSIFALMDVPLRCPDYTSVSKRAKSVNVSFKAPTRGEIAHLVIDSTGLKVFGEGERKVKKHGKERR